MLYVYRIFYLDNAIITYTWLIILWITVSPRIVYTGNLFAAVFMVHIYLPVIRCKKKNGKFGCVEKNFVHVSVILILSYIYTFIQTN